MDLNALIAAYYTANAEAQEYLRKIIAECVARGMKIDQIQRELESNKPETQ